MVSPLSFLSSPSSFLSMLVMQRQQLVPPASNEIALCCIDCSVSPGCPV
jgi:hypothetical protein